jgi:type III restriction enzyme
MELKSYQQEVIQDLSNFIAELESTENIQKAFSDFWENKGVSFNNIEHDYLKPYDNSIKGVPRVTVKVPTAGGKTFIACNALKPIFDSFPPQNPKVVVWFVPSDTILKQTYKNLNNPDHPYRQKINAHFGNAVNILDKEALLFGQNFNPTEIRENLSILVLSVQSFAANNKDGRRVYRENGNLAEFPKQIHYDREKLLENTDETALIQVIAQLNPVVIIDESHNFEADLRIDMLNKINPSFIFDLTATPRAKSNIISFVDAIKLKKNNMVKLPVIVYNHNNTEEVITSAVNLQKTLEEKAKLQKQNGGKFIRPIVLFQAQPKTADDNVTFEKIRKTLIDYGLPEKQIRIKTANKDEIKNEDLMSETCEVRYIITVNALKEGWDCPFAYILASLANKSSAVDVEQILGRVLRLPFTTRHLQELLNYSYVFTCSKNFNNTLQKIIAGLNKSGFSAKDYRVKETQTFDSKPNVQQTSFENLFSQMQNESQAEETENSDFEIDTNTLASLSNSESSNRQIEDIVSLATSEGEKYENKIAEIEKENNTIPSEIMDILYNQNKVYPVKEQFKDEIKGIVLPAFYKKVLSDSLFETKDTLVPLTKDLLLDGFDLTKEDNKIDFTRTTTEMASIDLEESRKDEYVPAYRAMNYRVKEAFVQYIARLSPEGKINQIVHSLASQVKRNNEIPQSQIINYIKTAIKDLTSDKIAEITEHEYFYASLIKKKIDTLTDIYAEKQFCKWLDSGKVVCNNAFEFPEKICPKNTIQGITKNLYTEEGEMNAFETKVINAVANLANVVFWHRNLERGKGFNLNGFINHYPDFIVKMRNGKIILIETKGDHLDGTDSQQKLRLGKKWASKAGDNFRYFMVFENKRLDETQTIQELIEILNDMK